MHPEQLELFDQPLPSDITRLFFNQAMRLFVYIHWSKTKMGNKTEALINHIIFHFDGRPLETIGRQDILNMRNEFAKKGFGLAYINKAHMIIKLMYNKYEAWQSDGWAEGYNFKGLVLPHRNPAKMVPIPKDPARERWITPWEYRKLIKFAKRLNDWDLVDHIRFAIWFRLSPIDLENFNDDEIDDQSMTIKIVRRHTITPKTPLGKIQIIPLTERSWGAINRRREYRKSGDKKILNTKNLKRRINRLRKLAIAEGMKDFTNRDFRRSGPGFLHEKGIDHQTIADGLGNTLKVAQHHYIPKTRPHLRKSEELLEQAFSA